MFGKIVQKWNAFKADWKEYQKLRRVAGRAWRKLYSLRARITDVHNPDEIAAKKSCIRAKFVQVPHQMRFDDMSSENNTLVLVEDYCPNFNAWYAGDAVLPCKEKSCSCYARHCEYASAAAEYAGAVQKRREFWADSQRGNEK